MTADRTPDFARSETHFLRGVPAAIAIASILSLAAGLFLPGLLRYLGITAICLLMLIFWWKILSLRTVIEIIGSRYILHNGAGEVTEVDLRHVSNIHWQFVPFQGSRVSLLEGDRVLLDLPCSRERRAELVAVGRAISASHPGRGFSDARATRALGLE
jgi:hypothetical protein